MKEILRTECNEIFILENHTDQGKTSSSDFTKQMLWFDRLTPNLVYSVKL
jgi:hypothetical protein